MKNKITYLLVLIFLSLFFFIMPFSVKPVFATDCTVTSFSHSPDSPVSWGTNVSLSGSGECGGGVRAVRFTINGESKAETSLPSQNETWKTNEYAPGTYNVCFEVAGGSNASWDNGAKSCVNYKVIDNTPPTAIPPTEPPIKQCWVDSFAASPNSASVGSTITLSGSGHCDGGVRAVRFLINGAPFGEFGGPNHSTPWGTSGLSAGTYSIGFQVASGSWKDAAISYQNVTLYDNEPEPTSPPDLPPTTEQCWVDSFNISPNSGSIGTTFTLSGSGHCSNGVRAVRFLINDKPFGEFSGSNHSTSWGTSDLSAGTYSIGFQVASGKWKDAAVAYQNVTIYDANQPAPTQSQEIKEPSITRSNGGWQVGAKVGLCAGAQIRSGSGFSYPTHTIIPENNWQVEIIDGPRNSDNVTWWNISRKNIDGGGTGWIYFEQAGADGCSSVIDNSSPQNEVQSDGQENNVSTKEQAQPEVAQPPSNANDCSAFMSWIGACAQAVESVPTTQPKICNPIEVCGFFDLACHWRNLSTEMEKVNNGCSDTPLPLAPTDIPASDQSQTNNSNFSEENLEAWLKQYSVTLGESYGNGQCKTLANAIVANIPSYGATGGAKQYIDGHPSTPLLKDIANNVDECDVILFISPNYLKYSNQLGHTAVVYGKFGDNIYYVEQNNPAGKGVKYSVLSPSNYDDYTYVIQKSCIK